MSNPKSDVLNPCTLVIKVIGTEKQTQGNQCIRHHQFASFIVAFLEHAFFYIALIPKIKIIDCKTKKSIWVYAFTPTIVRKSITARNMSVFKDLNINQFFLEKNTFKWEE